MRVRWLAALVAIAPSLVAATGYHAWLRYAPLEPAAEKMYANIPAAAFLASESPVLSAARQELMHGMRGMLGRTPRVEAQLSNEGAIVLATFASLRQIAPDLKTPSEAIEASYPLKTVPLYGHPVLLVAGPDDRGVLYGVFALSRRVVTWRRYPLARYHARFIYEDNES